MAIISKLADQELEADIRAGLNRLARLPAWLVNARDPEQVALVAAKRFPEFAQGDYQLLRLEIGHMRYKELYWTGLYEFHYLDVAAGEEKQVVLSGKIFPAGDELSSENIVEGHFGSSDWYAVIPELHLELRPEEEESVLDALELLTRPDWACQFLEEKIRARSPAYEGFHLESALPRVVRYKPGSRCTILYALEYENGSHKERGWPDLVVGKTYRGEKGKNAYDGMEAVWQSPLGRGDVVTVAEPLAYIPELRILIQGPVPEEIILKDLVEEAIRSKDPGVFNQMEGYLQKTAAGLAELHLSGVTYGRTWTWKDECSEVRERVERLSESIPELAATVDPLLERVSALFDTVPEDAPVPSHGSFRPAQVLLNHGKVGFIDFDSFAQAEPALDISLFNATVLNMAVTIAPPGENLLAKNAQKKAWQARYDRYLEVCDAFIQEYQKHSPVSKERIDLWQTLHILMLVLGCWIKNKTSELDATLFLLRRHLQTTNIASEK